MTRFPDAGHETLVHLLGRAKFEDGREPPDPSLYSRLVQGGAS